jgi:signal transduction histidine kinase
MIIALVGIITVQIYWINTTIEIRGNQFSANVSSALVDVSKNIEEREIRDYDARMRPLISKINANKKLGKKVFSITGFDTINNETYTYKQSILEKSYDIPVEFFNKKLGDETVNYKEFFSKKEKEISALKLNNNGDLKQIKPSIREIEIDEMSILEKLQFENFFEKYAQKEPIYKRVSNYEIQMNLGLELTTRGVKTPFEFAIYDGDFPTKIKSDKFKIEKGSSYSVPIFTKNKGKSNFVLYVNFPEKENYILSNIKRILIFASIVILLIILAFGSALYQLLKQKKISEIKTDFINNMTHEFKTPIATINLALDAIKNPKIIDDKAKVLRYTDMIRQENKRMHAQVENVLRISKLEKNQLEISKEVIDIHDIIEDAITHVNLIVKNNEGYVKLHFKALQSEVLGNELHFTNVIVNILDNAIKYTEKPPKIDIYTENVGNKILIKIKDQGLGMGKNVQKQVFNKFYREQKGNVHNVKGHGLGLSYVKKIVENHQGNIMVESEKGKGSTFIIKIPLI